MSRKKYGEGTKKHHWNIQNNINKLEHARELLNEAHTLISDAFADHIKMNQVKAYFLNNLEIRISKTHGFLTDTPSIDDLISLIKGEKTDL